MAVNVTCGEGDCHVQANSWKAHRLLFLFPMLHLNRAMPLQAPVLSQVSPVHFRATT